MYLKTLGSQSLDLPVDSTREEEIKSRRRQIVSAAGRRPHIGFIGHHLDQKRLKQGLWRCSWDDIYYLHDDDSLLPPGGDGGREPRQGMSHEEEKKVDE